MRGLMFNRFLDSAKQVKLAHPLQWIEVNVDRLRDNLRMLKLFLKDDTSVLAVVKANAYGHGLVPVARALAGQVEWFGVASLDEAIALREADIVHPILLFGHLAVDDVRKAMEWNLTLSVSDAEYGEWIEEEAAQQGGRVKAHVKIDTGMGRFGFSPEGAEKEIMRLAQYPHLDIEGLYTHFPQSEIKRDPFTLGQVERFTGLRDSLRKQGLEFKWVHSANSAGVVNYDSAHFNLVRPGLMLYGIYPAPSVAVDIALKPALSLKAKWVFIKKMPEGGSVGYGRSFAVAKDTIIGILPIGYSCGYMWNLGNKANVLYRGKYYPVAGRISMDYIAVNLGADSEAEIGDVVTLIGEDDGASIKAEYLAMQAGTIPYEVVTHLPSSLERTYTSGKS